MNTTRRSDTAQEKIITKFLDDKLYSRIFRRYSIVEDRNLQIMGVDVLVDNDGLYSYFDAKAQSSPKYIHNPHPTFSFELLFDDRGGVTRDGWFVNDSLITQWYILIWVNKATVGATGYIENENDIRELEVVFLNRRSLKEEIERTISIDGLKNKAAEMRRTHTTREEINNTMHLTFSDRLAEQPVNIVVKKDLLDKIADQRFIVTQGGYRII